MLCLTHILSSDSLIQSKPVAVHHELSFVASVTRTSQLFSRILLQLVFSERYDFVRFGACDLLKAGRRTRRLILFEQIRLVYLDSSLEMGWFLVVSIGQDLIDPLILKGMELNVHEPANISDLRPSHNESPVPRVLARLSIEIQY